MKVLMVCLGNICRSPTAEGWLAQKIVARGWQNHLQCDSAGTIATHKGELADPRTRKHAAGRGLNLTHISRPITDQDFQDFDWILVMDQKNLKDVMALKEKHPESNAQVKLLTDFSQGRWSQVPDPYYGGAEDFERVLDITESCCEAFLDQLDIDT